MATIREFFKNPEHSAYGGFFALIAVIGVGYFLVNHTFDRGVGQPAGPYCKEETVDLGNHTCKKIAQDCSVTVGTWDTNGVCIGQSNIAGSQ